MNKFCKLCKSNNIANFSFKKCIDTIKKIKEGI